jgi:hypothetical protein
MRNRYNITAKWGMLEKETGRIEYHDIGGARG